MMAELRGNPKPASETLMKPHFVCCIAHSNVQSEQIVQRLKAEAFPGRDISKLSVVGPMIEMFGDIAQSLLNQGVPPAKALLYASRILEGRILVSVQVDCQEDIEQAREVFRKAGANDISVSREAAQSLYQSVSFQSLPQTRDRLNYA